MKFIMVGLQRYLGYLVTQVRLLPFWLRMTSLLWLAWFLAVWQLGASDLWLDEAISFWIAERPLGEVLRFTMGQSKEHPPLYYVLLHLWMGAAGNSEFALRSLSGMGSLLAIALNGILARRWFGERVALLSALMLLSAPLWVFQIRDARMYSWLTMLALLNIYALDKALASPRWRDWVPFFLSLFVMLGTHYFSGLLLVGYGIYLMVFWRRLPEQGRWRLLLLLGGLGLLGGGWILSQPGPRGSLVHYAMFALESQRSWSRLVELLTHWALGNVIFTQPNVALWPVSLPLWLLALIGIGSAYRPQHGKISLPWLLALLVVLPVLLAFVILPTTHPRHVMATFGLYALAISLGIAYLGKRYRWIWASGAYSLLAVAVVVAILGLNFGLAFWQISSISNPFSTPMNYVVERARSDEPVFYTYYFDWPLDTYYNRRRLPSDRLTTTDLLIAQEQADAGAANALAGRSSLWLVLYPGLENTDRLEQAFNQQAFPTNRVWFPGDRGVVRYFSPLPLQERETNMSWANGIGLHQWWINGDGLAAGDAFRIQFNWEPSGQPTGDLLLVLSLFSPDQNLWVRQITSPCAGRCPTSSWADNLVADRMAFYVPTDVPPGVYEMRIGWVRPGGASIPGRLSSQTIDQSELLLTEVHILPSQHPETFAPAPPLAQPIGVSVRTGLALTSVDLNEPTLKPGAELVVPMQFRITDSQPMLQADLILEGEGGQHTISAPLGPFWHPSADWAPGQVVRVQPHFQIPGDVQAGRYRVHLALTGPGEREAGSSPPIGFVRIEDRARRFDVPTIGAATEAVCADGIQLVRFDVPPAAIPDSQVPLTLVWLSSGPASRNWKVFAHLLDAGGKIWSQADGYPLLGQAMTRSWQQGEVVVDTYNFNLPIDLPSGAYHIRLGFYDESTNERLRCGDDDAIALPVLLTVESP